jgi:hypothetical protein
MKGLKTGGRIKGSENKVTSQLREKISLLLENQFETFESELNNLQSKEKLELLVKLIPYVIPKQLETTNYNETDMNLDIEVTEEKIKELKDLILRMEL